MKNDAATPLPDFTGRLIKETPQVWSWGPHEKEKKRMRDILDAITFLKSHGRRGADVIGAYHARRLSLIPIPDK